MSKVSCLGNSIINKVRSLDGVDNSLLVERSFQICNDILDLCLDCYNEFENVYEELNNIRGVEKNVY